MHTHLYVNGYNGCICDCQKLEFIQLSHNWRMDELWYSSTMKYYLSGKRNKLLLIHRTYSSFSKRSQTQKVMNYNSISMPRSRKGKTTGAENRLVGGGDRG